VFRVRFPFGSKQWKVIIYTDTIPLQLVDTAGSAGNIKSNFQPESMHLEAVPMTAVLETMIPFEAVGIIAILPVIMDTCGLILMRLNHYHQHQYPES
jgi:hypothetical protein